MMPTLDSLLDVLTSAEVAAYLRISEAEVIEAVKRGWLRGLLWGESCRALTSDLPDPFRFYSEMPTPAQLPGFDPPFDPLINVTVTKGNPDPQYTAVVKPEITSKEPTARRGYSDTDIVGYHINTFWVVGVLEERVVCSGCWERMSGAVGYPDYRVGLEITFADTAEHELVCSICRLQLPTRGEP